MGILKNAKALLSATLLVAAITAPAVGHAKVCIVQKYDLKMVSQGPSQVLNLTYDSSNQNEGGDTYFYLGQLDGMTVERSSYMDEGIPRLEITDAKTHALISNGESIGKGGNGTTPVSQGDVYAVHASATYGNAIYKLICE